MVRKLLTGLAAGLLIFGVSGTARAATNVAEGKTVTYSGTFFGGNPGSVSFDTIVDGLFLPQGTNWQQNTVWWEGNPSPGNTITIDLGGMYTIDSFIVQVDDNDQYLLEYWNAGTSDWVSVWDIPIVGGGGMQTRPNTIDNTEPYVISPVTTDKLRLSGDQNNSDRLFAVSEVQAYGTPLPVPEPASVLLFGTGIAVLAGAGLKKRRAL